MTRGVGKLELLFPGPGLATKRLGSALTLCSSALPSSPLSSHPLPSPRAGASMAAPEESAAVLVSVERFSGASLAGGLPSWAQPTAHPEGHLLLNFTIAQAYGLQSPSPTRWKPRRPPEVRKSFRAQE